MRIVVDGRTVARVFLPFIPNIGDAVSDNGKVYFVGWRFIEEVLSRDVTIALHCTGGEPVTAAMRGEA